VLPVQAVLGGSPAQQGVTVQQPRAVHRASQSRKNRYDRRGSPIPREKQALFSCLFVNVS